MRGECTSRRVGVVLLLAMVSAQAPAQRDAEPVSFSGPYKIAGTVINASTGEPVSRTTVSILEEEVTHDVASTQSDAEGRFVFEHLAAGKYPLTASKRGYRTAFYDEHDGFNTAIVTGLDQGTEHLTFKPTPIAVLHGIVSGDGGDPVEGAQVMLFRKPRHNWSSENTRQVDTATTDDAGAYEFGNIEPGDYMVAVAAQPWYALHRSAQNALSTNEQEGNAQLDVAYPVTYFDGTTDEASASAIALTSGRREEANINLHAVPALRISVEAPRRADGEFLRPGIFVPPQLQELVFGQQVGGYGASLTISQRPGTAEFNGVAPGHYEMTAGDPPHILQLDARESGTIDPNNGAAMASVSGVLRMADGTNLPTETYLRLDSQGSIAGHGMPASVVRGGRFSLEAVAPGTWSVAALDRRGKALPVLAIEDGTGTHSGNLVTVRDRPLNIAVTLGAGGSSRLDGIARKDGKGLAGAMIELIPKDLVNLAALARRDQSDSDGSFSLRDVLPGQYTLVAIENGWDLDWSEPEVMARYLPLGASVTVKDTQGARVHLAEAAIVQSR
jgi:protocatechuate 3,4-dioxygenase beta subunit